MTTKANSTPVLGALAQRHELWHVGLIGLFIFTLLEGIALFQRRESPTRVSSS